MPSEKSARVSERQRARNQSVRSGIKTFITKAEKAITAGDLDSAKQSVVEATSVLDRGARSGVIHRNNAARRKSRLVAKLNKAQVKKTAPAAESKAKKTAPAAEAKAAENPEPKGS